MIYHNFQWINPELVNLFDVFSKQESLISVSIIDQFIVRNLVNIGKIQLTRD